MNVRKLPGCDGGDAGELVEVEGGRAGEVGLARRHAAGAARHRWRPASGRSAGPARATVWPSARLPRAARRARATSSGVSKTVDRHPASIYGGIATVPCVPRQSPGERRRPPARRRAAGPRSAARPPTAASRRRPPATARRGRCRRRARRKRVAAHAEPRDHRRRGGRELAAGARQDLRRHRVAGVRRLLHQRRQSGDRLAVHVAIVDLVNQLGRAGEPHVIEDHLGQQRRRPAAVELPDDGRQRRAANPEAAALVAEQVPPAAGARGACPRAFRPYAIDPVPATTTTPGSSPAPATSATSASLTTSVGVLKPMRRMMPRTASASAGRSTPAMPRQIAAGRTSGASGCCASAASITWCSTFSTSSSPADCRFAPPPRASAMTRPCVVREQAHRLRAAGVDSEHVHRCLMVLGSDPTGMSSDTAAPCHGRSRSQFD